MIKHGDRIQVSQVLKSSRRVYRSFGQNSNDMARFQIKVVTKHKVGELVSGGGISRSIVQNILQ